ncbi:hypothetical protein [Krasilnikovia cinnamomea]|uniref:hypothetical protein n=1 Tax=Krasilnikovia cinnamomea TaxID=349313 RepID=UPI001A930DCD|nr:hypothetical protein [Krasilnikovia cinnamomea]
MLNKERLTHATVVVMAMLAVYGNGEKLSFVDAPKVVVAPVIAVAIAHGFSDVLHALAVRQRHLTGPE